VRKNSIDQASRARNQPEAQKRPQLKMKSISLKEKYGGIWEDGKAPSRRIRVNFAHLFHERAARTGLILLGGCQLRSANIKGIELAGKKTGLEGDLRGGKKKPREKKIAREPPLPRGGEVIRVHTKRTARRDHGVPSEQRGGETSSETKRKVLARQRAKL